MSLPRPQQATLRELKRFDLTRGLPTAARVLRAHLTVAELVRVLAAYATGAPRDPLAGVLPAEPWDDEQDALVKHQLRAALRLDDATRHALEWPEADRRMLLLEVVAATGSEFIGANIPFPTRAAWSDATGAERAEFMRRLRGRMFNASFEPAGITDAKVGFDVHACRFAQLCRAMGRDYLAPMFCEADSRFFAESNPAHRGLIRLRRTKTIGRGDDVCDFRFTLR